MPPRNIRNPKPCTRCRELHARCQVPEDSSICRRCARNGYECVFVDEVPLAIKRARRLPQTSAPNHEIPQASTSQLTIERPTFARGAADMRSGFHPQARPERPVSFDLAAYQLQSREQYHAPPDPRPAESGYCDPPSDSPSSLYPRIPISVRARNVTNALSDWPTTGIYWPDPSTSSSRIQFDVHLPTRPSSEPFYTTPGWETGSDLEVMHGVGDTTSNYLNYPQAPLPQQPHRCVCFESYDQQCFCSPDSHCGCLAGPLSHLQCYSMPPA
jgi:hypothetical protein